MQDCKHSDQLVDKVKEKNDDKHTSTHGMVAHFHGILVKILRIGLFTDGLIHKYMQ